MNKTLVNSEFEVISFFNEKYESFSIETMEEDLGIVFADKNGKFPYHCRYYFEDPNIVNEDEDYDCDNIDFSNYKILEEGGLPEKYPCLIVHYFNDTIDRYGKVTFKMFEYVYLEDFNK